MSHIIKAKSEVPPSCKYLMLELKYSGETGIYQPALIDEVGGNLIARKIAGAGDSC